MAPATGEVCKWKVGSINHMTPSSLAWSKTCWGSCGEAASTRLSTPLCSSPVLAWVKPTHWSWGWWKIIRVSLRCGHELISHIDLQQWTSGCNLNFGEGCLLCDSSLVLFMIDQSGLLSQCLAACEAIVLFWLPSDSFSQGCWDLRQARINWLLRRILRTGSLPLCLEMGQK